MMEIKKEFFMDMNMYKQVGVLDVNSRTYYFYLKSSSSKVSSNPQSFFHLY